MCIIDRGRKPAFAKATAGGGGEIMKKRRVVKSHKNSRVHHTSRVRTNKLIWGLEPDFVLILGGGFLVVVLGVMILY